MYEIIVGAVIILMGVIFTVWAIVIQMRMRLNGTMYLNGEVIGTDDANRAVHIRYKIDKETFHAVSCPTRSLCLSLGIPQIGARVMVNVRRDDPYTVVSVLATSKMIRGEQIGSLNSTKLLMALRFLLLGPGLIVGGIFIMIVGT